MKNKEIENFRPIGRKILVDVIKEENITQSGLVITDSIKEDLSVYTDMANILKVGKDVPEIKQGDVVVFNPHSGTPLKFKDKIYLLLTEDNIHGVLE